MLCVIEGTNIKKVFIFIEMADSENSWIIIHLDFHFSTDEKRIIVGFKYPNLGNA